MAASINTRALRLFKSVCLHTYRTSKYRVQKMHGLERPSCMSAVRCVSHHSFPYPDLPTKEAAKTFVVNLDDRGRALLYTELHKLEQKEAKKAEGSEADISPPVVPRSELWKVFVFNGVPFIGFGLLDNFVMIVAGEYIDVTLGAILGISTMAAAALGNLISDVIGVGTAGYVEVLAMKVGMMAPDMTPEQANTWQTRWSSAMGRSIGITIGCIIGMFPLLFLNCKKNVEEDTEEDASSSSSGTGQQAVMPSAEGTVPQSVVTSNGASTLQAKAS